MQADEPLKADVHAAAAAPTATASAVTPDQKVSLPRTAATPPATDNPADPATPAPPPRVQADAPYTSKPAVAVEKEAPSPSEQQTAFRGVIEPAEKPKAPKQERSRLSRRRSMCVRPLFLYSRLQGKSRSTRNRDTETTAPRTTATVDHVQELQASDRSHTSSNVISVRLGGNEMSEPVDVRFIHRAGQVEMAVRTDDTQVADRLRGNLSDLTQSLKDGGFQVDFRHSGDGARSDRSFSQQQAVGRRTRTAAARTATGRQQQHRRPRNRPDEEFSFDE